MEDHALRKRADPEQKSMVREIQPLGDLGKCPTRTNGKDSVENPAEGREDDQETVNRKRKEVEALKK